MPSFKPKNDKKILTANKLMPSLDNKHEELMSKFNYNETSLYPQMKEERRILVDKFRNENNFDNKLELKIKIKELDENLNKIKLAKNEYLLRNASLIFDYFQEKKNISTGQSSSTSLDKFFNISNINHKVCDKNAQSITDRYLSNIDSSYLNMDKHIDPQDICKSCKQGEMIPVEHEGVLVCNSCGRHVKFLVENDKPTYKEPPKEVCFYAYKRINHFREILAQFQAKETTQIPDDVLNDVKLQIKKERIDIKSLTNKRAKDILKKLGYNKYYEHIPFIKDKLGIRPPIMSPELEERLCNLFMDIQGPYAKFCPEDRVNFLNYYYTVYKLCELLDQRDFLPYFPMLKDRDKRIEQDYIWQKICGELGWEFIPTL